MPPEDFENKLAKLLGIRILGNQEILDILLPIMNKYQIPKILSENQELSETVLAERTPEEWMSIQDEIEHQLRERMNIIPPQLRAAYRWWKKQLSNTAQRKPTQSCRVSKSVSNQRIS